MWYFNVDQNSQGLLYSYVNAKFCRKNARRITFWGLVLLQNGRQGKKKFIISSEGRK